MKPSLAIRRLLLASGNPLNNQAMFRKSATQRLCLTACAAVAIPVLTLVQSARGADVTWTGATNMTWEQPDTTSWSATYNSGDNVTFTSTGAGTVTISGTVNPGNFSITSGTAHVFTGAGSTLSANGTSFQVGPASSTNVTASMSGLSNFIYNNTGGTFQVGLSAGGSFDSLTTLTLAADNTITAANLNVANRVGNTSTSGSRGVLRLGAANLIHVDNINIGYSSRSDATLNFAAGSSSATFRGADGSSAVGVWRVGNNNNNQTKAWNAIVDFSNGTIDALVTELTIGCADIGSSTSRQGTQHGTFTMGAGTMTVTDLNIGRISNVGGGTLGGNMIANGTFTLNNAGGVLKVGTINLTTNTITANTNTRTVNGTFNLTNGTLEATTIQMGVQTGTATATAAFNFTGGTLRNSVGSDLAVSNVPINLTGSGTRFIEATTGRSVTVASTAVISGSGQGFTKTGDGTLTLAATNTYSGATTVSAGTLYVTGALSNSAVTVGANGTIGSNGANGTLNNGLALDAGSNLDLTGGTLAADSSNVLTLTGGSLTLGNLTFQDIVGWNWFGAAQGTYELIDGEFTVAFGSTAYISEGTAYDFGNGNKGYFTDAGGFSAVIIPEPSVALLSGLGLLALLRRRR